MSMSFFVSKAPLRLSMGGGGTDVDFFYRQFGGSWVSAAINRFAYTNVKVNGLGGFIVKYSNRTERVASVGDIAGNDLLRYALEYMKIDQLTHPDFPVPGIEINTISDAPTRSGLGVSGAIAVGLLQILHQISNHSLPTPLELAKDAYHVEHDLTGSRTGWQDQLIASHGGILWCSISKDGELHCENLRLDPHTTAELESNIMLFGTRLDRRQTATEVIESVSADEGVCQYLLQIKEIGEQQRLALVAGKPDRFGELLDDHWQVKVRYAGPPHDAVSHAYEEARRVGVLGGKVIGASTHGSFMMFYCPNRGREKLRRIMDGLGMTEIRWSFESAGSRIVYID